MIIFDLDGTLIDSRADLALAVNLTREDYGFRPLDLDVVIAAVGNGAAKLIERTFSDAPESFSREEALARYKENYARHLLDNTVLYDGIRAGLESLRSRGVALAVVSNKPEEASRTILDGLGVGELFRCIIGGGSGFALKPDPEALLHCLKCAGDPPETSWMVGDNDTDLAAGGNGGLRTAFAGWGFGKKRGYSSTVDLVLPREIETLV